MNKPKQAQLPNGKSNIGDLNFKELLEYYNKGLFVEARELLEYLAYLKGKSEVAINNKDIRTMSELRREIDYCNERMDFVIKRWLVLENYWKCLVGIVIRKKKV
jgi:Leu/Phe-tRNA-protein transferase